MKALYSVHIYVYTLSYVIKGGWKFVKAEITMNISDAKGGKEIGNLESRIYQFLMRSIHLSTCYILVNVCLFFWKLFTAI